MAKTYEVKIGSTVLQGLTKFEVERNKLWTDAGRDLAGNLKATFIGIFPKIGIGFSYLTEAEVKSLATLLDSASLSVTWWDSKQEKYQVGTYYAGDYKLPYFDKNRGMYAPWEVNLIPFKSGGNDVSA